MIVALTSFLLLAGVFFSLVAAIGIVRMPDIYCRMHAATKAGSFGIGLMLLALSIDASDSRIWIQSILIILFFFLTAPIGAHMIGRTGLIHKSPLWQPKELPEKQPLPRGQSYHQD